ncbi:MAG: hypothetical protein P8Y71_15680, partial [Pseudolabrys sp.]
MTEQPLVKVRILGKSETRDCEWRGTLFATGNNVTFVGDMTRRGLTSKMDARMERPETRKFAFGPIARVMADRGAYVAAGLTIARAYCAARAGVKCMPLGSYGGSSRLVREPLIRLGQPDPVVSTEHTRANDPRRLAVLGLFGQWREHLKIGEPYTVPQIIDCARETRQNLVMRIGAPDYQLVRPEFSALLLERCPAQRGGIDAMKVGKWFSQMQIKSQVHSDYRLEVAKADNKHGNRWML